MTHSAPQDVNSATSPTGMSRLLGFAVFSVAVHGLLLVQHTSNSTLFASVGARTISVTLSTSPQQATSAAAPPAPTRSEKQPIAPQSTIRHARLLEPNNAMVAAVDHDVENPTARREIAESSASPPIPQPIPENSHLETLDSSLHHNGGTSPQTKLEQFSEASDQRQAQYNFLLGQVQSLLAQYLSYPLRARRRGWEGEVLLGFEVDSHGRLGNVHLARSSGYSLLDNSALAALSQVKDIPLFDSLSLGPMELQLPVRYQLQEG